jgi:pseudouridine-5'-phosphate glycosidase
MNDALRVEPFEIAPDVREALGGRRGVVALETAVMTLGLPRTASGSRPACADAAWDTASPLHLETVRAMHRAVLGSGAVPAAVGILDGRLRIGLDDLALRRLAADGRAAKAAARDLAPLIARRASAGTTVSAALAACALTHRLNHTGGDGWPGIRVLATGGIGGAHRGWSATLDLSGDLAEIARTPVCIVCSGCKSILDVPATLEALETLGVPVIGWQTETFPQFLSRGDPSLRVAHRLDDPESLVDLCITHWRVLRRPGAVLVAQPVPGDFAIDHDLLERAAAAAVDDAGQRGVRGPGLTPALLAHLHHDTGGRALHANIALLLANTRLAADVAAAFARAAPAS